MPKRKILGSTITQWTPGIRPTWTVDGVRNALRQHADGQFDLAAQLIDTMGEDDELPGSLEKRVDAVLSSDFALQSINGTGAAVSKRVATRFEPEWWDILPEDELGALMRWKHMLGVGIGVLDWTLTASTWMPRLRTLSPHFLRWDPEAQHFFYRAREGEFMVEPGDGRWVLLVDGQRGWLQSGVRALAVTWLVKQFSIRDWARYNERHGLPIVKAMAPAVADDGERDEFWEDLQSLNSEVVAQLLTHIDDNGAAYDLDLLEAVDRSWETFERNIQRCDRKFQVYLTGANLQNELVKEGARATSDTHRGVERTRATADARRLSTRLRVQVLHPAAFYNLSGAQDLKVIPWPTWDTAPAEDDKGEAEAKMLFGQALQAIQDAGWDVENVEELAERYGLKLKERETPPPLQGAPVPGQPGQPQQDPTQQQRQPQAENSARWARLRGMLAPKLQSGAPVMLNQGFIDGQLYADAAGDFGARRAAPILAADLEALAAVVNDAKDFDEVREGLVTLLGEDYDPDELAEIMSRTLVLTDLAGRLAVRRDTPELARAS